MRTRLLLVALLAACSQGDSVSASADMAESTPPMAARRAPPALRTESVQSISVAGSAGGAAGQPAPPPPPAQAEAGQPSVLPTMLIRTGEAWVEVKDLDPAIAAARRLAAELGGFVGNSMLQGGREETRSATLTLKIPAARFDQAVGGLGGLGRVERVSVTAEDVGEEFTDVTARVANARRLEARLLDLLARRTGKLEEVLAVERELSRIREDVERMEGRLRYLRTRAAVSTLTLTIHEPHPIVGGPGDGPFLAAVRQAWRNFVGFVAGFIASLGVLVPVALLLAAAWWIARRMGVGRRGTPVSEPGAPNAAP